MKCVRKQLAAWARTASPRIIHFNSGSCNGCDIETVASLTPKFDVERFGIMLHGKLLWRELRKLGHKLVHDNDNPRLPCGHKAGNKPKLWYMR